MASVGWTLAGEKVPGAHVPGQMNELVQLLADDDRTARTEAAAAEALVANHPLSEFANDSGVVPVPLDEPDAYTEVPFEDAWRRGYSGFQFGEGIRRQAKAREEYQNFIKTDVGKRWLAEQEFRNSLPPDHPALVDGPINMVWPELWFADAAAVKGLAGLGFRAGANGWRWATRGSTFGPRAAGEMIDVGGRMVPRARAGYVTLDSLPQVQAARVAKHAWGAPDAGSRTARITAAQQQRVAGRAAAREANKSLEELRNGLAEAETAAGQKVPTALDEFQTFARAEAQTQEFARQTGVDLGATPPAGASPEAVQWSKTLSQSAAQAKGKMDAAVQALKTQQANIDKAAAALDEAAPGLAEKAEKALAQVNEATAELKTMKETPWWKATRWNQNSHVWRFGEAKSAADPLLAPSSGGGALNWINFFTGRGVPPRAVSGLMRGIGREILPFEFDTASRLGAVMHWLTSPNAASLAMTLIAGKKAAWWAGKKLGWISPASESELVQENNARATVPAHDVPMTTPAPAGSAPQAAPTTDQVVDRVSMDFIRRKYASMAGYDRAAAAAERDRLLASLPDEVRQSAVDDVRERVFKMHHPGASYRALRAGGDKNKAVLDRFDADVFGTRSENDWLTEDLNAYQRGLNMKQYGGEF